MKACVKPLAGMILAGLVAGPAWAETLVEAYGLGRAKPVPEEWTKIDEDLSIRVRLLRETTDKLAARVGAGETIRVVAEFYVQPGAADRDIYLTCSLTFYDAEGEGRDYAFQDRPCYKGRLHDGLETFQPLVLDLRLKPRETDPKGTSAVILSVKDRIINDGVALAPTYDWQGGR